MDVMRHQTVLHTVTKSCVI